MLILHKIVNFSLNRVKPYWINYLNKPRFFASVNNLNMNTKVIKDVIMYKYDNPTFFKVLNFFGIAQFIFWTHLSNFAFTNLKDIQADFSKNLSWWRNINLGERKFRYGFSISCFILGAGVLTLSSMYTFRSVRYLILRKGGDKVAFVTYTPFGNNRIMNVPLKDISCMNARTNAKALLPIKVKRRKFNYLLDMSGEFKNPELFDFTAGIKRKFC